MSREGAASFTMGSDEAYERHGVSRGFSKKNGELRYRYKNYTVRLHTTNPLKAVYYGLIFLFHAPGVFIHESSHIIGLYIAKFYAKTEGKIRVGWVYRSAPIGNLAAVLIFLGIFLMSEGTIHLATGYLTFVNMMCFLSSEHDWNYDNTSHYTKEDLDEAREILEEVT